MSGSEAKNFLERVFCAASPGTISHRRPALGRFQDSKGRSLDRVLVTFFPKPASYTGEDVAEISCHGSPLVTRQVVEVLLGQGARLAQPGEFTLRAFLNGKIDLAQAEAVRDLIESQTAFQARLAREQLEGKLSRTLEPLKEELVRIVCHMETAVEFVEDQVEPEGKERLIESLQQVKGKLESLEESFRLGRMVHDGIFVTITGKPNAGKSSIFNSLLRGRTGAIVASIPGTTRDALTESINLRGIPARLVDTAGIREARDEVESLGSAEVTGIPGAIGCGVVRGRWSRRLWEGGPSRLGEDSR